jgi:hypothetical protein
LERRIAFESRRVNVVEWVRIGNRVNFANVEAMFLAMPISRFNFLGIDLFECALGRTRTGVELPTPSLLGHA